jgi:hypothetical protein
LLLSWLFYIFCFLFFYKFTWWFRKWILWLFYQPVFYLFLGNLVRLILNLRVSQDNFFLFFFIFYWIASISKGFDCPFTTSMLFNDIMFNTFNAFSVVFSTDWLPETVDILVLFFFFTLINLFYCFFLPLLLPLHHHVFFSFIFFKKIPLF